MGVAAQSGKDFIRPLTEKAGSACHLPLLPVAIREDFHLGADGHFVIGQTSQGNSQGVVAVASFISQYNWSAAQLGDDQVRIPVAIEIGGNHRARTLQLDFAQLQASGHILKSLWSQVAQYAQLRSMRSVDKDRKVDPSIIVNIDSGQSPASYRVVDRQRYALKMFAIHIAP